MEIFLMSNEKNSRSMTEAGTLIGAALSSEKAVHFRKALFLVI